MENRPTHRLPEFEGLRGLLSWWVVLSHALFLAGYEAHNLGRGWRLAAHGEYPVDVFVILSGFVIHKLWHDSREPYRVFIARRFLRLWPAYIVCILAALALRPLLEDTHLHSPLGDSTYIAHRIAHWNVEELHYWKHLATHLPMIHGAVPETLLPGSASAILGPPWSISLEWQFYLIAPLLFMALLRGGSVAWVLFAALAGAGWMVRHAPPFITWFPMESSLPQKLLLFAIGIASHELWRSFRDYGSGVAPVLLGLAVLILAFTLNLPLAIWTAVLAVALSRHNLAKRALNSAPLQFLGRISYSTYLAHMLVLWSLHAAIFAWHPAITGRQLFPILFVVGAPLILLLSVVLHRWVELPAIRLGRTWQNR